MSNKENIYNLIVVFIGTSTAFLIERLPDSQNIHILFQVLIVFAISIVIWFITWRLNESALSVKNAKLVEKYEFEKQLKGLWLERYKTDDFKKYGYGVIDVIYDDDSKTLHLKGNAYDQEGTSFANWTTKSVYLDRNTKSVLYIYDGEFNDGRLEGNGYGKLDFSTSSGHSSVSGSGFFEDSSTEYKPVSFEIEKLDFEFCKRIWDEGIPERNFDKANFIKSCHQYYTGNTDR